MREVHESQKLESMSLAISVTPSTNLRFFIGRSVNNLEDWHFIEELGKP